MPFYVQLASLDHDRSLLDNNGNVVLLLHVDIQHIHLQRRDLRVCKVPYWNGIVSHVHYIHKLEWEMKKKLFIKEFLCDIFSSRQLRLDWILKNFFPHPQWQTIDWNWFNSDGYCNVIKIYIFISFKHNRSVGNKWYWEK